MEGTRLDLDAPLISVRRIAADTASSAQSNDAKLQSRRETLHSGHSENSGSVPFIWEKRPGHPKENSGQVAGAVAGESTAAPNLLPPGRILINASLPKPNPVRTQTPITCSPDCGTVKLITRGMRLNPAEYGEECDVSSDAWDTLSCNESFSMKSGVTGFSARPSFRDSTSQFSKDPLMEEYMIGRFLPAAQAMASGSPQRSWKKPPRAPVVDRKTVPQKRLPLQYQLSVSASQVNGCKEEEEEDEEEVEESDETASYESTGYFSSKARGLISRFRLKSLLKPVFRMKVRDLHLTKPHRSIPRIKISNDEGIVEVNSRLKSWFC